MFNLISAIFFSLFFGTSMAVLRTLNGNPNKLTLRGRRVAFVVACLIGFIIYQIAIRLYVDCDLTTNNSPCNIGWINL
jgi:uncharacterized membrane protein YczE